MDFSQFCACGPSGHAQLKHWIDACAQQGHSYEFPACTLPAGCVPPQVRVGFWRERESYLLYFRPAVSYEGSNPRLAEFWAQGNCRRFETFHDLRECLQSLDGDAAALRPAPPMPEGFTRLNRALQAQVLGQRDAVEAAAFKLYGHICKTEPLRPLSLIFYGPTCVGKSQLAKQIPPALDAWLGYARYQLVWTELNTFTEAHSVYRLTGAPPGYVGYEDPPVLEAVRRNPYSVFLFDELDKAHPEVLKVFMSILDEGRCTAHRADNGGERELDFRRCVFVFTTNADLTAAGGQRRLGFSRGETAPERRNAEKKAASPAELAERLFEENEEARRAMVRHGVLTEIAGRFSGLIGFQRLDESARLAITVKQIRALGREYGLEITAVAPETIQALAPSGDALSMRSSVSVLEGVLTPVLSQAPPGWKVFSLTGTPDRLRLVPDHCGRSSSSTELLATSSL